MLFSSLDSFWFDKNEKDFYKIIIIIRWHFVLEVYTGIMFPMEYFWHDEVVYTFVGFWDFVWEFADQYIWFLVNYSEKI